MGAVLGAVLDWGYTFGLLCRIEPLQARGVLYIAAQDEVYNGQIIGVSAKADEDVECNPTKAKALTNFRAAGKDDFVRLAVPQPHCDR